MRKEGYTLGYYINIQYGTVLRELIYDHAGNKLQEISVSVSTEILKI